MNATPDTDFIVAGGARYGLGHVMRSATLAQAARDRGWRVQVYFAGDRSALERWRAVCPDSVIRSWSAWRAAASSAITVFDHPFSKSRWLDACRRERTRTIVIDDPRAIGRARLTINPALHHAPDSDDADGREDDPAVLVLRGPRHAILAAPHRAIAHRPLAERHTLLVSLGGADPHRATPRIAPLLMTALRASRPDHALTRRRIILGPAFRDEGGAVAAALRSDGWEVECALDPAAMAARMAEARLAVMGFGTSLCELAWHGTPHLSLTHHAHDDTWARLLEERGIGRHLGGAACFDADFVTRRFTETLRDRAWQESSARLAREALEGGRGIDRILDRLAEIAREVPALQRASERRQRDAHPSLA